MKCVFCGEKEAVTEILDPNGGEEVCKQLKERGFAMAEVKK